MSKITYLLGAGASYGERGEDGTIVKGVPIISEFNSAIESLRVSLINRNKNSVTKEGMSECITTITDELIWLSDRCKEYPTIDTFAKMLYVTQRYDDYERLKRILSIFLILEQFSTPHDLRYDGFIASLIDNTRKLPPIDILTWNYDAQFEIAYSDYSNSGKYIAYLWNELNVMTKTIGTGEKEKSQFSIIKLNGTALFIERENEKTIIDISNGGYKRNEALKKISEILKHNYLFQNTLSYSWENNDIFTNRIAERVQDTTSLVVIGYSFPYVNREVDRKIIQSMRGLKKIYIQDPLADEIRESVQAVLLDKAKDVEIVIKKNTRQFFIPNEL